MVKLVQLTDWGLALTHHVELIEMNSELLEGKATFVYEARKNRGLSEQNKWLNQQFEKGLHYIQVLENQNK